MNWEFIRVYKSDYVNFDITSLARDVNTINILYIVYICHLDVYQTT